MADDCGTMLRLMQLVLTAVDSAGADGYRLTRDSAVASLARALVGEATGGAGTGRTAMMALRDLVWRVDMARELLLGRVSAKEAKEVSSLLDTADIHAFIRSAAPARPAEPETDEEIARSG